MRPFTSSSTRSRLARNLAALAIGSAALLACGDDDSSSTATDTTSAADTSTEAPADAATSSTADTSGEAPAEASTVTIERSRFVPEELAVPAGTTVEFVNLDPFAHTVTSAEGSDLEFDSGELTQDETFEQTFDEPGSYDYFCEIHPTMRATVVVE